MKPFFALLLCLLASGAGADGTRSEQRTTAPAVLDELAVRSGLPKDEMQEMLSHCEASRLNMNFCGLRDQVVAEAALEETVKIRKSRAPSCAGALDSRIAAWRKKRDTNCSTSAAREYGGGSMEKAADLICRTSSTRKFAATLAAERTGCAVR